MQESIEKFMNEEVLPPMYTDSYLSTLPCRKITIVADTHPSTIPFIYNLCNDKVMGDQTRLEIALLNDDPDNDTLAVIPSMFALSGFPSLKDIYTTEDNEKAFSYADVIVFLEGRERVEDRIEKIIEDYEYFKLKAKLIEKFARKNVKIIMAGQDPCLYAYLFLKMAPTFIKKNITGVSRHYAERAAIHLANELKMNPSDINRIIVVGKDIPDVTNAVLTRRLNGFGLFKKSEEVLKAKNPELYELIQSLNDSAHVLRLRCPANPIRKKNLSCNDVDNRWLKRELYKKCKKTPMLMYSFATSLSQHLKCWMNGSPNVENMIVISDGSYGVPKGFFCSFPVKTYKPGVWFINEKLTILTINCEILKCQLREINKDYCLVDEIYTQEEHNYRYVPEPNCNEEDFNNLIYGPDDEEA